MLIAPTQRSWQTMLAELDTLIDTVSNPLQISDIEEDIFLDEFVDLD